MKKIFIHCHSNSFLKANQKCFLFPLMVKYSDSFINKLMKEKFSRFSNVNLVILIRTNKNQYYIKTQYFFFKLNKNPYLLLKCNNLVVLLSFFFNPNLEQVFNVFAR